MKIVGIVSAPASKSLRVCVVAAGDLLQAAEPVDPTTGVVILRGLPDAASCAYPVLLRLEDAGAVVAKTQVADAATFAGYLRADTARLSEPTPLPFVISMSLVTAARTPTEVVVSEVILQESKMPTVKTLVVPPGSGAALTAWPSVTFTMQVECVVPMHATLRGYTLDVVCADLDPLTLGATPDRQRLVLSDVGTPGVASVGLSLTAPAGTSVSASAQVVFQLTTPNGLPMRFVTAGTPFTTAPSSYSVAQLKALPGPFVLRVATLQTVGAATALAPTSTTMKGKVVYSDSTNPAANLAFTIFGRTNAPASAGAGLSASALATLRLGRPPPPVDTALATGVTRSTGTFQVRASAGHFDAAFAVVGPDRTVCEIVLDAGGTLPPFALLVIPHAAALTTASGDCACAASPARLPDGDELTSGGAYSQDIGGSCVNFTIPNRTLEEFSHFAVVRTTDPEGEHTLINSSHGDEDRAYVTAASIQPRLRQALRTKGQVAWDWSSYLKLPLFQATSLAHGHLLHYKNVVKADGYSMGDLLYSVPLAPGQKKQIVVNDWSRRDAASRVESTDYREGIQSSTSRTREIDEIMHGSASESVDAKSRAQVVGWNVGVGASVASGGFGGTVGASYSNTTGSSSASQDASRSLAASMQNRLRERILQRTSLVRSQRVSVVTTSTERERQTVQSTVIANHNHCHALTIQYFEVLRHFVVEQELADVQECLFVPLEISYFTPAKAWRWRELLASHCASAIDRVQFRRYFEALGELITLASALPPAGGHAVVTEATTFHTLCGFAAMEIEKLEQDKLLREYIGEIVVQLHINRPPDPPEHDDHPEMKPVKEVWHWIMGALKIGFGEVDSHYTGLTPTQREARFQKYHAPRIAEWFVDNLEGFVVRQSDGVQVKLNLDFSLVTEYRSGRDLRIAIRSRGGQTMADVGKLLSGNAISSGSLLHRKDIGGVVFRLKPLPDTKITIPVPPFSATAEERKVMHETGHMPTRTYSVPTAAPDLTAIVRSSRMTYRTDQETHPLYEALDIEEDIGPGESVYVAAPMRGIELTSRLPMLKREVRQLLAHLNGEHLEHYHHAIWIHGISSERRFLLLDRVVLSNTAFNDTYAQRGVLGRSVASLVENRIIGIVGNCIVLPVAAGQNLDPSYVIGDPSAAQPTGVMTFTSLLEQYQPLSERDGDYKSCFRLSVQTPGVFAEAVLGACNSCEREDDTRFSNWEDDPIDEPTAIEGVTADSRYQAPTSTAATALPASVINIQQAGKAPTYTNTAELMAALAKKDAFADMTGLAGNMENSSQMQDGLSSQAKAFADQSARLAKAAIVKKHVKKLMAESDERYGAGTQESEARQNHIQALASGSTPKKNHSVRDRLVRAARGGAGELTYSHGGERMTVRGGGGAGAQSGGANGTIQDILGQHGEELDDFLARFTVPQGGVAALAPPAPAVPGGTVPPAATSGGN